MAHEFTQAQRKELERIGNLYRETIYDPSLATLPDIVKAFGNGLKEIDGDISSAITPEVFRYHKLITSKYFSPMRKKIDSLYKDLSPEIDSLHKDLSPEVDDFDFSVIILCRQKSWESTLRKSLKYYFEGKSVSLSDIIALRIIVDSNKSEKEQKDICRRITDICINTFRKHMCTLMPPAKIVGNNPLYKDYINYPKLSGYESIHLAFMDKENFIFEVQIRTQEMDANAEFGLEVEENIVVNENNLAHVDYKNDEYKDIIPFIHFDPEKVIKPFFRCYKRSVPRKKEKKLIIVDKIGLMKSKPIEERARTF